MPKINNLKKLVVIALFATALATPLAVRAYAQDDQSNTEETVTTEEAPIEEEVVIEEEEAPVEELPEEVVEETEEEVVIEEEESTPVTLVEAIAIAQIEHPDAEVIKAMVRLKSLNDEKVFKVVFADGWRIYVRASDGEIVLIKDSSNDEHALSERGIQAVRAWRVNWDEKWHRQYETNEHSFENRKNWWHRHHDELHEDEETPEDEVSETEEVPVVITEE